MDLEKVFTVQGILLILTGVFLLVMGIKVVIRQTKIRKQDLIKEGTVLHSRHVEQRDKEGFLTENYYELRAEYHDKGHRMEKTVYSVEEYLEGDTIRLVKAPDNGKDVFIYKEDKANGIGAWVWIAAGIAVILIPFIREALGTGAVSIVEAVFLLAIGISLIAVQVKEEKKSLNRISARIVEVLKWKEGSKTRGGKPVYTYYPIYEYKRDDVTRRWRGMNGSEQPSQYKTGTRGTLYWRQDDARLMEKEPGRMLRYVGIVLVAAAVICVYGAVVLAF